MRTSSLIVGRVVDFDVNAGTSLYELIAVDGRGRKRRVGHLSRDADALYVADLFAAQPLGTLKPPRRFEGSSKFAALAWTLRRLRRHELDMRTIKPRKFRVEPRPHGAPVDDARDPGPRVYRVSGSRGVAVWA